MAKIDSLVGAQIDTGGLGKFIPEPKSRVGFDFGALVRGAGSVIGQATSAVTGMDPIYSDLLQKQIEVQQQMQIVSMESNIEKSKHETQMAAIRNVRVG